MRFFTLTLAFAIFLMSSFCLLIIPGPALAQPSERGPGWILKELDLSSEQQEKLACDTPGQGREVRAAYERERDKLNDMIRDTSMNDDAILTQLDRVNAAQADWNLHRLQKILKARSVLSPEQLQKFLRLQEGAHLDK